MSYISTNALIWHAKLTYHYSCSFFPSHNSILTSGGSIRSVHPLITLGYFARRITRNSNERRKKTSRRIWRRKNCLLNRATKNKRGLLLCVVWFWLTMLNDDNFIWLINTWRFYKLEISLSPLSECIVKSHYRARNPTYSSLSRATSVRIPYTR